MSPGRRWFQRLLPAFVSAAALFWLFSNVEIDGIRATLSWRVVAVLVPSLLVYGAVALAIEAASIMQLTPRRPEGFGPWTAARIKCATYLLGIVNYALGAGALAVLLRRRAGLGLGASASVVLLISSLDLVIVIAFGGAGAAVSGIDTASLGTQGVAVAALVGMGFFGGLTLLRIPGPLGPLERIRSLAFFGALRTTPLSVLAQVGCLRVLFSLSFISLSAAAFYAFDIWPGAGRLIAGMMFVALVSALPIAVAGLGTGQAAVLVAFRGLAEPGALLAMSLVLSAGMILLRAAMGLIFAREFTREALDETRERDEVHGQVGTAK